MAYRIYCNNPGEIFFDQVVSALSSATERQTVHRHDDVNVFVDCLSEFFDERKTAFQAASDRVLRTTLKRLKLGVVVQLYFVQLSSSAKQDN